MYTRVSDVDDTALYLLAAESNSANWYIRKSDGRTNDDDLSTTLRGVLSESRETETIHTPQLMEKMFAVEKVVRDCLSDYWQTKRLNSCSMTGADDIGDTNVRDERCTRPDVQ